MFAAAVIVVACGNKMPALQIKGSCTPKRSTKVSLSAPSSCLSKQPPTHVAERVRWGHNRRQPITQDAMRSVFPETLKTWVRGASCAADARLSLLVGRIVDAHRCRDRSSVRAAHSPRQTSWWILAQVLWRVSSFLLNLRTRDCAGTREHPKNTAGPPAHCREPFARLLLTWNLFIWWIQYW